MSVSTLIYTQMVLYNNMCKMSFGRKNNQDVGNSESCTNQFKHSINQFTFTIRVQKSLVREYNLMTTRVLYEQ